MADIGREPSWRDGTDRAQLVLVAALAIAVAMVVLVVLLNGAIYTQNLAMRSPDAGGHDALQFRAASASAVAEILDDENGAEYDNHALVRRNVSDGVERYGQLAARSNLGTGGAYAAINESSLSLSDGWLLRQTDGSRNFTNRSGEESWTFVASTPAVRQYDITITDAAALFSTATPSTGAFNVTVRGNGGNEWRLYVYEDSGTKIAVKNGTGSVSTDVCTPSLEPRIDLTAGTVDGDPCPALEFGKGTSSPYNVSYRNGAEAVGTYNLTVDTTSVAGENFIAVGAGPSPYQVPAVYDVRFTLVYDTSALRYADSIRVAPGEPA